MYYSETPNSSFCCRQSKTEN